MIHYICKICGFEFDKTYYSNPIIIKKSCPNCSSKEDIRKLVPSLSILKENGYVGISALK